MCIELGMHLCFWLRGGRRCLVGKQVTSQFCSHMDGRVNAWSRARVGNQGKSLSCSHSSYILSSGKPSKGSLSAQAGGFGKSCGLLTLLGACHSGEGGLLTQWGLGLGRLNRGTRSIESTVGLFCLTAPFYHGVAPYEVPTTTTTSTYGAPSAVDNCRQPGGSLGCRLLA